MHNRTYINKILEAKSFEEIETNNLPLTISNDVSYNRTIETAIPLEKEKLLETERQYGFSYRQAIGELIYAMVTCRPDISFPLIKLSQYSAHLAIEHLRL